MLAVGLFQAYSHLTPLLSKSIFDDKSLHPATGKEAIFLL